MPAETVQGKARRLLSAGRLLVERVDDDGAAALCAGDHDVYEVGVRDGRAWCSCPATRRCAHMVALELVLGRSW